MSIALAVTAVYDCLIEAFLRGNPLILKESTSFKKWTADLSDAECLDLFKQLARLPHVRSTQEAIGIEGLDLNHLLPCDWATLLELEDKSDFFRGVYAFLLMESATHGGKVLYDKQVLSEKTDSKQAGLTRTVNKLKDLKIISLHQGQGDEADSVWITFREIPSAKWVREQLGLVVEPLLDDAMEDVVEDVLEAQEVVVEEASAWANPLAEQLAAALNSCPGETSLFTPELEAFREVHLIEGCNHHEYALLWWIFNESKSSSGTEFIPHHQEKLQHLLRCTANEVTQSARSLRQKGLIHQVSLAKEGDCFKLTEPLAYYEPYLKETPARYQEGVELEQVVMGLSEDTAKFLRTCCESFGELNLPFPYEMHRIAKASGITETAATKARRALEEEKIIELESKQGRAYLTVTKPTGYILALLSERIKPDKELDLDTIECVRMASEPCYRFAWYVYQYSRHIDRFVPDKGLAGTLLLDELEKLKVARYFSEQGLIKTQAQTGGPHGFLLVEDLDVLSPLFNVIPPIFNTGSPKLPLTIRQLLRLANPEPVPVVATIPEEVATLPVVDPVIEKEDEAARLAPTSEPTVQTDVTDVANPADESIAKPMPTAPMAVLTPAIPHQPLQPQEPPLSLNWVAPKRYFIVDTENIPSAGYKSLMSLSERDTVVLMFTQNSQRLDAQAMHYLFMTKATKQSYYLIPNGKNSLDHAVSGEAYIQLIRHPDSICYIVSKDKGYKTGIAHMIERLNLNPNQLQLTDSIV